MCIIVVSLMKWKKPRLRKFIKKDIINITYKIAKKEVMEKVNSDEEIEGVISSITQEILLGYKNKKEEDK